MPPVATIRAAGRRPEPGVGRPWAKSTERPPLRATAVRFERTPDRNPACFER